MLRKIAARSKRFPLVKLTARMPRAYLCVTIDTECDKGPRWHVRRPLSFSATWGGVPRHLGPIFRAHGAKATYLVSPEVMRDERSVHALAKPNHEVELGTHLHSELVEPNAPVPQITAAFQRDEPNEVEQLTKLTALFKDTFGRAPRSFRAGRFGIGPRTIGALEDLGYLLDSSVTPNVGWTSSGAPGLEFFGAPTQPYHPNREEPKRRGEAKLWEIPITIHPHTLSRVPGIGAALGRTLPARWLRPTKGTSHDLVRIAKDEIKSHARTQSSQPCILNMMFHNVEIIPGTSPYADDEIQAEGILRRLYDLLGFARSNDIAVVGLADAAELCAS